MKNLKMLGRAAVAAMALMAIGAGSASATTLEVSGVAKNASVEITASLEPGTSSITTTTPGGFINTCTSSHLNAKSASPFTGTKVTGPIATLTFTNCVNEPVVTEILGQLYIEHIPGSTNGTVFLEKTAVTEPSTFGTITCNFGNGTDIGTLTGKASGQATIDVKAVVNCGFLVPSVIWEASYVVTSPAGLGVIS